ncbi:MAG: hypothetical protein H6607_09590 [Flavobacteriales bacterium]|nr:hypothetical protein [Flavobacteriales bacterium]
MKRYLVFLVLLKLTFRVSAQFTGSGFIGFYYFRYEITPAHLQLSDYLNRERIRKSKIKSMELFKTNNPNDSVKDPFLIFEFDTTGFRTEEISTIDNRKIRADYTQTNEYIIGSSDKWRDSMEKVKQTYFLKRPSSLRGLTWEGMGTFYFDTAGRFQYSSIDGTKGNKVVCYLKPGMYPDSFVYTFDSIDQLIGIDGYYSKINQLVYKKMRIATKDSFESVFVGYQEFYTWTKRVIYDSLGYEIYREDLYHNFQNSKQAEKYFRIYPRPISKRTVRQFDENYNPISVTETLENGEIQYKELCDYDEYGNLVKFVVFEDGETTFYHYRYTYY